MYAGVIVDKRTKSLDRIFDYEIPDGISVLVGNTVIVPFGPKNIPTEAYVINVSDTTRAKKIKKILSVSDKGIVFDEKMIDVINYMREKYLCTYIEAVHAVLPAGIDIKSTEYIVLVGGAVQKGERRRRIIELLEENGGSIEFSELCKIMDSDISTPIRELVSDGVIKREFFESRNVKDKTVTVVSLAIDTDEAVKIAKKLSARSPKQAKVLEFLAEVDFISTQDLKGFIGECSSQIKALLEKGYVKTEKKMLYRELFSKYVVPDKEKELTAEQKSVLYDINKAVEKNAFSEFLLWGVTGSGKTEVFMQAVLETVSRGKQAIVLVPEISLTPQTVARFKARFGDKVAVFHSGLSQAEKFDQWKRMRDGLCSVVVGARSAVFAPFKNLGLIVIDEEHSDTYKSDRAPRYDAREVARFRANQADGVLLLASATPRIEDFYKASTGKMKMLKMEKRFNDNKLPDIHIVDMREELKLGNKSVFSKKLYEEIKKNLEAGEQTILFLNRRGFSTFVSCRECGFVAKCPNCNISLTYHKSDDSLRCHYCGHEIRNYYTCPDCGSRYIRYFGGGTQKVEEEVKRLFPTASVIRMDIDTTGKKQSHEEILSKFENEKTDILIGTQMVSKGLDFENVTLVGVISADVMLNADDFRSAERTFDILEQVTGRAGRGEKHGRAVVQTYTPEHTAVVMNEKHDYSGFYEDEIELRRMMWYPPFCEIVNVQFTATSPQLASRCAKYFYKTMEYIGMPDGETQILGPIPCALSKINNKFRWQIIIKCENADKYNDVLIRAIKKTNALDEYGRVQIAVDKNPLHIF